MYSVHLFVTECDTISINEVLKMKNVKMKDVKLKALSKFSTLEFFTCSASLKITFPHRN